MVTFSLFFKPKGWWWGGELRRSSSLAALQLYIYFFSSSFKLKASCIRSLWNLNPRNISVLVTSSGNNKAEFEPPLMLTWQGHLGVQQAPAAFPSQSLVFSGLACWIVPCSA